MQTVPFKNKRGDVPVSLHMLSDTGANGKDTVDIHAHTSGSRAEHAAGKRITIVCAAFLLALSLASAFPTGGMAAGQEQKPITLKTMGSLLFGGTVIERENGDTFHGDHGYAQFYIPQKARNYPLILWHGMGQSGRSWESTPDGREGFQALLTRRDWPLYIIDQPRRGRAGYTASARDDASAHPTSASERGVWNAFRNGIWVPGQKASLYPGVRFPSAPAAIDQFFRQQTFNTGQEPRTTEYLTYMGNTAAALLRQTGPAVLVTHSNSGKYGWFTAMASDAVKAIVAYEPGQFVFPEGETARDIPFKNALANEMLQPINVSSESFRKLTQMPILIIYGDNIATEPSDIFNVDVWRIASTRARHFVDAINRNGGDATLAFLPEIGIKGNTHAPFADLNNLEIADHLEQWLHAKGLDGRGVPHRGPAPQTTALTIPLQQDR